MNIKTFEARHLDLQKKILNQYAKHCGIYV